MAKKHYSSYLIALLSSLIYGYLFYAIERHQSLLLVGSYTLLFGGYLWFITQRNSLGLKQIIGLAIGFRLITIAAIPALSDDFYRFIWDGRLWLAGINPFALFPQQVLDTPLFGTYGLTQNLYDLLNSPTHYTVYPPIAQYINVFSALLASHSTLWSVLIMRFFIIAAEILSFCFLIKLLQQGKHDAKLIGFYALNPLVIIELSGNLHHEALMIAFFLGFVYFTSQKRMGLSGLFYAFAVGSKLLPLLFLPFILLKLKPDKRLRFLLAGLVTSVLLFSPLFDYSFFTGMKASLTLYYQKFEFNTGLYYLAREIGYWIYGYNAIALIGKLFFATTTVLILFLSYRFYKKLLPAADSYLLLYFVFCIFSLILHPWYILLLLAITPITVYRFTVLWSFLIFFTYLGYSLQGFNENYWVVGIEYSVLIVAFLIEWKHYARSSATLKDAP